MAAATFSGPQALPTSAKGTLNVVIWCCYCRCPCVKCSVCVTCVILDRAVGWSAWVLFEESYLVMAFPAIPDCVYAPFLTV